MSRRPTSKRNRPKPKAVLQLPDLDQARSAVLNSLTSTDAQRGYRHAIDEFVRYATWDIRIRIYGDTAVVSGRLQRTRQIDSKELSDHWRFTKVYVRQAQQWRVVSFHASEAAQQ